MFKLGYKEQCVRNLCKLGRLSIEEIAENLEVSQEEVERIHSEVVKETHRELSKEQLEELSKRLAECSLMDDDYMNVYFAENNESIEFILRRILGDKDLKVVDSQVQYGVSNITGKGVRLDVLATDSTGKRYDVEVQNAASGAVPRRARYNSSLLDYSSTVKGMAYEDIADTYVIFITDTDVLKTGLPVCHIDRQITETGNAFEDGAHIMYLNSRMQDDTEIGRLMHDYRCKNPDDMYYSVLAKRARDIKEMRGGGIIMSGLIGKWMDDAEAKGRADGIEASKRRMEEMERKLKEEADEKERKLKAELEKAQKDAERQLQKEAEEKRKLNEELEKAQEELEKVKEVSGMLAGLNSEKMPVALDYLKNLADHPDF